jgi:AraC family transcriptional regulator
VLLYYPASHGGSHLARWRGRATFSAVLLNTAAVAAAAEELEVNPLRLEFLDRLPGRDQLLAALATTRDQQQAYVDRLMHATALQLVVAHTARASVRIAARGGLSPRRMRKVEDYARAHLAEATCVADLAAVAGLSQWHFTRVFVQTTGMSPWRWVQRLRMEHAAALLADGRPLLQAVLATGHASPSHFTKMFRRHFGVTPGQLLRSRT